LDFKIPLIEHEFVKESNIIVALPIKVTSVDNEPLECCLDISLCDQEQYESCAHIPFFIAIKTLISFANITPGILYSCGTTWNI
jgi:hypothetical protein